jgi:hypothetical protein
MHRPFHHATPNHEDLHVIVPVSNTQRYRSRYRLLEEFQSRMPTGVVPHLTEVALGDRPFETESQTRLRTWDELWHKERSINLAVQRLPEDWQYVAWVDGDVTFVRDDWAHEAVQMLQHHMIVQLFQTATDLGPDGEALRTYNGFVYSWEQGFEKPCYGSGGSQAPWHPGYGWAMRREAWEFLGGLFDVAILGSGDHHMAWSLIGEGSTMIPEGLSYGYLKQLLKWEQRATMHIKQDIGYVKGALLHHWHGKKKDRRYADRWKILQAHDFNPDWDLKCDSQGLYALTHEGERMRNDLRAYFRARNEDSIDA